jgi:hypothetical protein
MFSGGSIGCIGGAPELMNLGARWSASPSPKVLSMAAYDPERIIPINLIVSALPKCNPNNRNNGDYSYKRKKIFIPILFSRLHAISNLKLLVRPLR